MPKRKFKNTSGFCNTVLYNRWIGMLHRCYSVKNKSYHRYGGRGIFVCEEWKDDFSLFKRWSDETGFKNGLQLDRIDNNQGYSPHNCRWVTRIVNARNKENTKLISFNNALMTIRQAIELHLGTYTDAIYSSVQNRMKKSGMSAELAIKTPFSRCKKVYDTNNDVLYNSVKDVCAKTGLGYQYLCSMLSGNIHNNTYFVYLDTDKYKQSKKRGVSQRCKKVINTQTGQVFESATLVSQLYGYRTATLSRKLSGERNNDTVFKYI